MGSSSSTKNVGDTMPDRLRRQFWLTPVRTYFLCGAISMIVFVADVILPRGATVAIGYCVVPAVAAGARSCKFVFGMTTICTVLTWVAFFVEPPGHSAWMSAFDRSMVTCVTWFALFLVFRRATVIQALVHQTQLLENTTQELERSNGELMSFASVVAHDLRGPLNTAGLFVELLSGSSEIESNVEMSEHFGSIRAELIRMSGFIQSLLTYGRVGSGDLRLEACDCDVLLNNVRRNLKADLERNGAEVSNDPLPFIRADPVLIAQVFQNLIENSIKYRSEAPPWIYVSAVRQSHCWHFSVQDNGIGIRSGDLDRVFGTFYQANSHKSQGVGLGLATCKRIIERHGGHFEVQSKAGAGSTFLFTIPLDPTESFSKAVEDRGNSSDSLASADEHDTADRAL
jgi:signal transduction histidine kinase